MKKRQIKKLKTKLILKWFSGYNSVPRLTPKEIAYVKKHPGFSFEELRLTASAYRDHLAFKPFPFREIVTDPVLTKPRYYNRLASELVTVAPIETLKVDTETLVKLIETDQTEIKLDLENGCAILVPKRNDE
jgi:hypothetical protein